MSTPVTSRRCGTAVAPKGVMVRRPDAAPSPHALSGCAPIELHMEEGKTLTLKGLAVALHAGLDVVDVPKCTTPVEVGELSGAVAMPSSFTRALVCGRSWPVSSKLYSWRVSSLTFVVGDSIEFHPTRTGTLVLWPMMLAVPYLIDRDLDARTLQELHS